MLVREVIQRVQSLYSRGTETDDSRLTSRHIYNKLTTVRSRVLANRAKDNQMLNQWNYQTLPCIELVVAPIFECPCIPSQGCKILKSKYPIPRVITDKNVHLIQSITTLDGNTNFSPVTFEGVKNQRGNKYTATTSGYYIRNEYLYITHNTELDVITMTALFTDPDKVHSFPSYCTTDTSSDCTSPLDREFPVDAELIDGIIEMSVNELIFLFKQQGEDKVSNASDDTASTPVRRNR